MKTNVSSVFFGMQAAVKYMRENNVKGNVLNVTSVAGEEPVYGAYGASKTAATALTKGWGKLAMYLLSKEAEMICGETVILDGGYYIR